MVSVLLCWATSSLSDLFAKVPLLAVTQQPLTWAASALSFQLPLPFVQPVQCVLQPPAAIPKAGKCHPCFPAHRGAIAFCHRRLQIWIAGGSHTKWTNVGAASASTCSPDSSRAVTIPSAFVFFLKAELSLQSPAHDFSDLFSKSAPSVTVSYLTFWSANRVLAIQSRANYRPYFRDPTATRGFSRSKVFF